MSVSTYLKSTAFSLARTLRAERLVRQSTWRRKRLLILCYHGVSVSDEHDWSDLYVSREFFARRLSLLRGSGVRIAPLAESLDALWRGKLTEPTVSITFDDGPADFALHAAPLLRQHEMHATVYLTTYYCQHQLPVFDPWAAYLMWKGAGHTANLGPLGSDLTLPPIGDLLGRTRLHNQLRDACTSLRLTGAEKNVVLRNLSTSLAIDFDELCGSRMMHIMNQSEIRTLSPEYVSVELHSHRHRSPDDPTDFREELDTNERIIQDVTGDSSRRRHYCYPSGVYDDAMRLKLAQYPVASATTCDPGIASQDTDHLLLPRFVDTMAVSDSTFLAWVTGVAALLPRRRADGSFQF